MKVILLVAMVVFAAATPTIKEQWTSFKRYHGKSYHSVQEERRRMSIFNNNLKMIEDHNDKYEAGLVSYSMAMNHFGDMLPEEVVMLGVNRTKQINFPSFTFLPPADAELPESVDWRKSGAVTPVKNQDICGSCWAFSSTGAVESHLFIKTGKLVSLSEQQLMDCSKGYHNDGCKGGELEFAFDYIRDVEGLEAEDSYPYEGIDTNKCRYNIDKVVPGTKVKSYLKIADDESLKSGVATVGPVAVGVSSGSPGFVFYDGGIFDGDGCSPRRIDHAMLLVGYGTEDGEDYWLVKNSLGTDWGEDGYMRVTRKVKNVCGISSEAMIPVLQ